MENYKHFQQQEMNSNCCTLITSEKFFELIKKNDGERPIYFDGSHMELGDIVYYALLKVENNDKDNKWFEMQLVQIPKRKLDDVIVVRSNLDVNSGYKSMLPIIKIKNEDGEQ